MPQLSEQKFNEIAERVIASAPDGLSEDQLLDLIDREAMKDRVLDSPLMRGAAAGMSLPIGGQATVLDPAIRYIGNVITKRAVPMVRSALKQGFEGVRRRAGIEGAMPAEVANRQAQFIVDKQLRTPEQADALVKSLGGQVDDAVARAEAADPNLVLDTATRIPRYMNTVLRRVEQQILPGKDRNAIQNVGRELVEDSPLSRSTYKPPKPETLEAGLSRGTREAMAIEKNARKPHIKADDGPHQFTSEGGAFPKSSRPRELRTDVKPSEGVRMVRTKSFYDKDASGGQIAGGKAIERAVRDSVKQAVPATKPLLKDQGRAIDAREALDRATWRDANRDQVGMGGLLGLASGRPILGMLLQGMKEGQLSTGLAAAKYGPRISRNAQRTGEELQQFITALLAGQSQD